MGLTRTEQWTLIAVVTFIAGGFAVQSCVTSSPGPVVWVEEGESWHTAAFGSQSPQPETQAPRRTRRSGSETDHGEMPSVAPQQAEPPAPDEDRRLPPTKSRDAPLAMELNTAKRSQLELLPGIGPVKAEAILEYRTQSGTFESVDQLLEVKGIGPKTLEGLRPLVRVESVPSPSGVWKPTLPPSDASDPYGIDTHELTPRLIDINGASSEELQSLHGIGPVLAERIIESRSKAPFRSVEELRRVRGIGPKTLERLQESIEIR